MSPGLDIREPPRRSTTSSNPSPPLRNCVVGKRWSQATRGWPPAVQLVHAFQNAFCLKGARRPGGMHRSMAIDKNQVAALRFTKRSQFCMHSRETPPLLSLPLRWVNRFGCATRDHLKLVSTQPCLACGRSPSDAHSQVCTSARARTQSR